MEALAVVGLAGNIITFIDFSCRLFDQANSIHHSHEGSSTRGQDLEYITQHLEGLTAKLSGPGHGIAHASQTSSSATQKHAGLYELAKKCQATASELLVVLKSLKAKDPTSKWSSFRAALSSVRRKNEVDAFEKALTSYRVELILELQILESEQSSVVLGLLNNLKYQNERLGATMLNQISDLRADFVLTINTLKLDQAKQINTREEFARILKDNGGALGIGNVTDGVPIDGTRVKVTDVIQSLVEVQKPIVNMASWFAVLDNLAFEQMEFRHSQIHDAHPATFAKVYDDIIAPWLRSPSPLFWLSGKPGSGKSTFMKYIAEKPRTSLELQKSFSGQVPLIASHYFWVNGSDLQRSQEGLLRTLLYDLFRQNPELIEMALPEALSSCNAMVLNNSKSEYVWRRAEIFSAYRRLAELGNISSRLCVFIDGLDEFKGDHDELVDVIRHLKSMGIKICVASRPWNIFEEAFGAERDCKLYLQDVTRSDIELYVNDKLRQRPDFQKLLIRKSDAEEIVSDIIEKSQGVFLWVFLVVRSLNEGLRNQDRISQLRKRLEDFPSDLEVFFGHMFRSIESTYRIQTAHMFQVALQLSSSFSPLFYWFLDELEDDPDMALKMPIGPLSNEELQERIEQIKVRITGRCKGLMEIVVDPRHELDCRVDFLHRTVKDFLATNEVRDIFVNWQLPDFDPNIAICKAILAELKCVASSTVHEEASVVKTFNILCDSIKPIEHKHQHMAILYLGEAELAAKQADEWLMNDASFVKKLQLQPSRLMWRFQLLVVSCDFTSFVQTRPAEYAGHVMTLIDRAQSLKMIRILVSSEDFSYIRRRNQTRLLATKEFREKNRDEVFEQMMALSQTVILDIGQDGQFHYSLHGALQDLLTESQLFELYSVNLRQRKNAQYTKGPYRSRKIWFKGYCD